MSTKSYAMETRDRLVEAGNFADAGKEVLNEPEQLR